MKYILLRTEFEAFVLLPFFRDLALPFTASLHLEPSLSPFTNTSRASALSSPYYFGVVKFEPATSDATPGLIHSFRCLGYELRDDTRLSYQ